jgi:TonB-dependent receptor
MNRRSRSTKKHTFNTRVARRWQTLSTAAFIVTASTLGTIPAALAQKVTGEVTSVSGSQVFQGAIVRIEELNMSTSTDNRGRFSFASVPPGSYTLVINYVGAQVKRIPVTVPADGLPLGTIELNVADLPEARSMEHVVVTGQSAAMAGAINQQRAAANIKSVLDSDNLGQFPDQNVAESLRRLSGVSVENDQGEGRYVVIRGLDPDLNSTSIEGIRASATEPRRALQLDVISTDILDGIEVEKSLTPAMDGDAIGGSINLKTLSAFSRKDALVRARIEGGYNELREEWSPDGSLAASDTFELSNGHSLGVAAAFSYQDRDFATNNFEADDWVQADNGDYYPETFEPRYYKINRERTGGVLNLDYDLGDTTTFFARSLFSRLEDNENRLSQTYGDLSPLGDEGVTGNGIAVESTEIAMGTKDRKETADTLTLSTGSESQWDQWGLKTKLGYSYAEEKNPDEVNSAWVSEFESGSDDIDEDSPVLTLNTSDPERLVVQSDYFDLLRDPSRYELDEIELADSKIQDTQWSFQTDATRQFTGWELQFGAKARLREKESNEDIQLYGGDDVFTVADLYDPGLASDYGFPNPIDPLPSLSGVRNILASGEGIEFEEIDSQISSSANDWKVDEDIYAGYGLVRYELDNVLITGGARVEYTDFSSNGNEIELIEEGEEFNGEELDDDLLLVNGINASKSYTDVLPSMNVRYDATENVVARAAVSRSIVRPLFEQVASRIAVEDNEAEIGNPDLEPFSSWNYDLSLEYYPTEISVVSAGVFYKQVDDFIFTQVLDDFDFGGRTYDEAVIALNGDEATVAGLELNYQQQFGFLASPFDGLLLSANYTYIDSDAKVDGRDIPLPATSDNLAGLVLGYDKYGIDLRLAMKYRDRYLDELVAENLDRYTDAHTQWDFSGKYHVTGNWMVFAEVVNITDEPALYYAGNRNRPLQYDEFGRSYVLGVQYVY